MIEPPAPVREPQPEPEPPRYIRLPLPVVAGGLFLVLAGLLALGLYANRNLRPIGVLPTPNPQAIAAATAPPTLAVTAQIPVGVVTPPQTLPPTPLILVLSTPSPVARSTDIPPIVPSGTPTSVSTAAALDPVTVREVSQSFERYWQVRTQALLDLDKTHLSEVMGGAHLKTIEDRIDELRREQRAIKTDVDHDISVISVTGRTAQIVDDYISNSVYIDFATREPLSPPASDELRVLYQLDKSDGTWKVVDSVQTS